MALAFLCAVIAVQALQVKGNGLWSWQAIAEHDAIPWNAVRAGWYSGDGWVYVGEYRGEAGKINCYGSRTLTMDNFWGHHYGQSHQAEILVLHGGCASWQTIRRGWDIPANA